MIGDTNNTSPNVDRITELLRQAAAPQTPDFMDTRTGSLAGYAAVYRGEDPMKAYQGASRMNVDQKQKDLALQAAAEKDIYTLMLQQKEAGNKEAGAVMDAVLKFAGNDPTVANKLLSELNNDPEEVDSRNITMKLVPIADRLGLTTIGERKLTSVSPGSTLVDERGNVVRTVPSRPKEAPASLQEKTRSEVDAIDISLKNIDTLLGEIKSNPGDFGAPGAIKDIGQTIIGGMSDVSKSVPGLSGIDSIVTPLKGAFDNNLIAKYTPLENNLAAALAAARVGGGKPPVYVLDQAKKDVSLQGLRSSEQVAAKLQGIKDELEQRRKSASSTAGYLGIQVNSKRPSLEEIFQ
jgi:hypothetical protein